MGTNPCEMDKCPFSENGVHFGCIFLNDAFVFHNFERGTRTLIICRLESLAREGNKWLPTLQHVSAMFVGYFSDLTIVNSQVGKTARPDSRMYFFEKHIWRNNRRTKTLAETPQHNQFRYHTILPGVHSNWLQADLPWS